MDTTLINCKICEKEFDSIYEIDEGICDECQKDFEKTFKKEEKIKIAKSNEHIPTDEIKQDILETIQEIVTLQREIKGLRIIGDRMSMFRADGKESGIKERRFFVEQLEAILDVRKEKANN